MGLNLRRNTYLTFFKIYIDNIPVLCTLGFIGNVGILQIFCGVAAKKMSPPAPRGGVTGCDSLKLQNFKTLELFDFGTLLTRPEVVM